MLRAPNVHRSTLAPVTLPDEQIDYWAEQYIALRLARRGVSFEIFLTATPQVRSAGVLPALAVRERTERYRLLSSKEILVLRKALGRSVRIVDNGRLVEKLRHHRHPRSSNRDFIPES